MAKLCAQAWVIKPPGPAADALSFVATETVATHARISNSFRIFLFLWVESCCRSIAIWISVANAACSSKRFR